MEIEHELAQRPLQPGQRAPQHDKARPGHPAGPGKIHQAEPLADRLVRQRCEIEMRLLAVMPQDPIRGLVGTVRHVFGRQVRQLGQDLVDLRPQPGGLDGGLRLGLAGPRLGAERTELDQFTPDRSLAALFGGPKLAGPAVRLRRPRRGAGAVERARLEIA